MVYSYDVVIREAQMAHKSPQFQDDEGMQKLKVHPSLDRHISTEDWFAGAELKQLPKPIEVRKRMEGIQPQVAALGFDLNEQCNADDTGIMYGERPKN